MPTTLTPSRDTPDHTELPDSRSQDDRVAMALMEGVVRARLFGEQASWPHIGRFEVRGHLGQGGMGLVVRAWDPKLEREVAIKLLHTDAVAKDARARRRIEAEAKTLARLNHPNVVHVYEFGEHEGALFIVMELVEGSNLAEWIAEAPRSTDTILHHMAQAALGLAAAHATGVVHRDFKPGNVLIGDDGRVRVVDFGIARAGASDGAPSPFDDATHAIGTPAYMAPEQIERHPATPATDAFAFGIVLYELLEGSRPFAGDSLAALQVEILNAPLPEPAQTPTKRLRRLLDQLLVKKTDQRLGDLASVAQQLERARGELRTGGVLEAGRWRLPALGLALFAAVAAWGAFTRFTNPEVDPPSAADVSRRGAPGPASHDPHASLETASPTLAVEDFTELETTPLGVGDKDASIHVARDERWLAVQANPGRARVWDLEDGVPSNERAVRVEGADAVRVVGPAQSEDAMHVIARFGERVVLGAWGLLDGEFRAIHSLPDSTDWFHACTFFKGSADGKRFAVMEGRLDCGDQGRLTSYDILPDALARTSELETGGRSRFVAWAWSPDGQDLAVVSRDSERLPPNDLVLIRPSQNESARSQTKHSLDTNTVSGLTWLESGIFVSLSATLTRPPLLARLELAPPPADGATIETRPVGRLEFDGHLSSGVDAHRLFVAVRPRLRLGRLELGARNTRPVFDINDRCGRVLGWVDGSGIGLCVDRRATTLARLHPDGTFETLATVPSARVFWETWDPRIGMAIGSDADGRQRIVGLEAHATELRVVAEAWEPRIDEVYEQVIRCSEHRCIVLTSWRERTFEVYELGEDGNSSRLGVIDFTSVPGVIRSDGFDLSRDASELATPMGEPNGIVITDMKTMKHAEVRLSMPTDWILQYVVWKPDGSGWYGTGMQTGEHEDYRLFDIDRDGSVRVLWASPTMWLEHPLPSPDGATLWFSAGPSNLDVHRIEIPVGNESQSSGSSWR